MKVLRFLFRIFYFLYPYKFHRIIQSMRNVLYSLWIRNFIGHLGNHSKICVGCRFVGGLVENINVGDFTIFERYSVVECLNKFFTQTFSNASITIGNYCNIGEYNHITAINKITIGNGFLSGRFVLISDNSHGGLSEEESLIAPANRMLKSKGEIVIGNNVWLGDKVAVLAGVHIGNNVIVAANAVVTKDLPDNCMAAGVPARVIKKIDVS